MSRALPWRMIFTALEIRKYDTKNEDVLYEDSAAVLGLYRAALDAEGNPQLDADGTPLYREEDLIFTFRSATYRDGQDVAATGRLTPDAEEIIPLLNMITSTSLSRIRSRAAGTTRSGGQPAWSICRWEAMCLRRRRRPPAMPPPPRFS